MAQYLGFHYDIEADWVMNALCNFDCDYCFGHSKVEHPLVGTLPTEEIVRFFNDANLIWLIHLTGGEPFFYPDFIELCKRLTERHFISVNTNLTSKQVFSFAEVINPNRVAFIHCGLHIVEREKRHFVQDFVNKFHFLQRKGFNVFASLVMYPLYIKRFPSTFKFFKSRGITIIPKAFRGSWAEKRYPESYTQEESDIFVRYSIEAERVLVNFGVSALGERPTIDPFVDRQFVGRGIPSYNGMLCRAGLSFVRIQTDGIITRCGMKTVLGNLFQHKLDLFPEPRECNDSCCPYLCKKYLLKTISQSDSNTVD